MPSELVLTLMVLIAARPAWTTYRNSLTSPGHCSKRDTRRQISRRYMVAIRYASCGRWKKYRPKCAPLNKPSCARFLVFGESFSFLPQRFHLLEGSGFSGNSLLNMCKAKAEAAICFAERLLWIDAQKSSNIDDRK